MIIKNISAFWGPPAAKRFKMVKMCPRKACGLEPQHCLCCCDDCGALLRGLKRCKRKGCTFGANRSPEVTTPPQESPPRPRLPVPLPLTTSGQACAVLHTADVAQCPQPRSRPLDLSLPVRVVPAAPFPPAPRVGPHRVARRISRSSRGRNSTRAPAVGAIPGGSQDAAVGDAAAA